ncbi:MAG: hypothetical protein R3B54_16210 [Bdellovibrionota bacterium]
MRRYPKRPGNPFSSATSWTTVNCNEFIYSLFLIAVQLLAEEDNNQGVSTGMQDLRRQGHFVSPRRIDYEFFGALGHRTVWGAETVGGHKQATRT